MDFEDQKKTKILILDQNKEYKIVVTENTKNLIEVDQTEGTKTSLNITLKEGSSVKIIIRGYYQNLETSLNLILKHLGSYSNSLITHRSILKDKSRYICQGEVIIPKTSLNCQTDMQLRSILLSCESSSKLTPILRIHSKQTKARHGAVVSGIPDITKRYLKTRGIKSSSFSSLYWEE